MSKQKLITTILGLGIFIYIFKAIGWQATLDSIVSIGWKYPIILLPFSLVNYVDTWGWLYTFPKYNPTHTLSFSKIYWLRICGEAFNNFTPSAHIGGDILRILILKKLGLATTESSVSVILDKTTIIISEIVFIYTSLSIFIVLIPLNSWIKFGIIFSLILAVLFVYLLIWLMHHGALTTLCRFLDQKLKTQWASQLYEKVLHIDQLLGDCILQNKKKFWLSNLWHYIGWILGALETWLMLYLMNISISLLQAIMIEGLLCLAKGLGFFIIGSLGVMEGSMISLFQILNLGQGPGLAFTLLKRSRELIYGILGWSLYLYYFNRNKNQSYSS